MKFLFKLARLAASKLGIYQRLRFSGWYLALLRWRNPSYMRALDADEKFYRSLFPGRVNLVFDVGANIGDKAEVFSRFATTVVCFEPDPRLAEGLRLRFKRRKDVIIQGCGISEQPGSLPMHIYGHGSAYNTFNQKQHEQVVTGNVMHQVMQVPVITLHDAIARYGVPDFLKVDVEGHEKEVFFGLHQRVGLLSFEANFPAFVQETCEVIRHLHNMEPGVRFSICGSGIVFDHTFPLTADALIDLVIRPDVKPYLEIFAKM